MLISGYFSCDMTIENSNSEWIFRACDPKYLNLVGADPTPEILQEIRDKSPVRRPSGRGNCIITKFYSHKMKRTIVAESRSIELIMAYMLEYCPDVVAYYHQPYTFWFKRVNKAGKLQLLHYTPDFLVVLRYGNKFIYLLIECKPADYMESRPHLYRFDGGVWHCDDAEAYLNQKGFSFSVFSDRDASVELRKNFPLLLPYAENQAYEATKLEADVISFLSKHPLSTIADLRHNFPGVDAPVLTEVFYSMIWRMKIFVRIDLHLLEDEEKCIVFTDIGVARSWVRKPAIDETRIAASCLEVGTKLLIGDSVGVITDYGFNSPDKLIIDFAGSTKTYPINTLLEMLKEGVAEYVTDPIELDPEGVRSYSDHELNVAKERRAQMDAYESGRDCSISRARYYRYRKAWSEALSSGKQPLIGLMDNPGKGNTQSKIPEDARKFLIRHVRQSFLQIDKLDKDMYVAPGAENKCVYLAHGDYKNLAEERGLHGVSRRTYQLEINKIPQVERVYASMGYKAANTVRIADNDDHKYERESKYPGDIAYIDCTLEDINLKLDSGRKARFNFSNMIDGWSGITTSYAMTFMGTSHQLLMTTIRRHVEIWNYKPRVIYVDRGIEYTGDYLENIGRELGINIQFSPAGDPRKRAEAERQFRTFNGDLFHILEGGVHNWKEKRALVKGKRPEDKASWGFREFIEVFQSHIDNFNSLPNSGKGFENPISAFIGKRASMPATLKRSCSPKDIFWATLIPILGRTRKNQGYVSIANQKYYHPVFKLPENYGRTFEFRHNPLDDRTVFFKLPGDQKTYSAKVQNYASFEKLDTLDVIERSFDNAAKDGRFKLSEKRVRQSALNGAALKKQEALRAERKKASDQIAKKADAPYQQYAEASGPEKEPKPVLRRFKRRGKIGNESLTRW